jgi:DNA primase
MPGIDFNVLRRDISMEQVLRLLQFEPVRRLGDQLRGPCPIHGASSHGSRSFAVHLSKGRYYCHTCHSGGNQLELWAAAHRMRLYDAAVSLCYTIGREVPWIVRW